MKEQYKQYCCIAKQLITKVTEEKLLEKEDIHHLVLQLQECFDLPITECSVQFFEKRIARLRQSLDIIQTENQNISEMKETHYTKVKKNGMAYIPVDDTTTKDINIPVYNVIPVDKPSLVHKGQEFPSYILKDKSIPVASSSNHGSSHILMLALISFLLETFFLVLAFFIYH